MQIAIWEIVGGSRFSVRGNDYGARALLRQLQFYAGPHVNLIALSGPGQDYAVLSASTNQETGPTQTVPETGATFVLFAIGVLFLPAAENFRRRQVQRFDAAER